MAVTGTLKCRLLACAVARTFRYSPFLTQQGMPEESTTVMLSSRNIDARLKKCEEIPLKTYKNAFKTFQYERLLYIFVIELKNQI